MDEDENGFVDCDDFSCSLNPWITVCGPQENTDALCTDGMDNDEDGRIDCADNGCSSNVLVSVCSSSNPEYPQTEAGFCADQYDNDQDGQVDCNDDECAQAGFCAE